MSDNSAPSSERTEQTKTSSVSSNNTTPIDPQSALRPLRSRDVVENGHVAHNCIQPKKNHKKDLLKRYYNDQQPRNGHYIRAFEDNGLVLTNNLPTGALGGPSDINENIQPPRASASRSPRNSTSSSRSTTPAAAAPKLTLFDFLAVENNDNSPEVLINRPPSCNSTVSTISDSSSQASTIPLESNKRSLEQNSENISDPPTTANKRKKKTLNTDPHESIQPQNSAPGRSSPENDSNLEENSNSSNGSNATTVPVQRLRVPTKAELKQGNSTSGAEKAGENNLPVHSPENDSPIGGNATGSQEEVNQQPGPSTPTKIPTTTTGEAAGEKKKKRRKYRRVHYYRPVGQVLRQINIKEKFKTSITLPSLQIMDNFMKDMFDRLACEAANLLKISGRQTMTARDMEFATRLVLPPKLAVGAVWEANQALQRYSK